MEPPVPSAEHDWLARLAGNWTLTGGTEAGSETAEMVGGVWLVISGRAEFEGGGHSYKFTLGFDQAKGEFTGCFISSMMTNLWTYRGWLENDVLVLEAEGPDFYEEGKTALYHDFISLEGDTKLLRSECQLASGEWQEFMRQQAVRA